MLCLGLLAGLDRPGPCPGHLPSQPYHPARLFPLRKCRQLSFGARGKQVSEPRVMEPSEGGKTQGKLRKHTPAHTAAPRTGISSTPCWERGESPSAGDPRVPTSTSLPVPSPRNAAGGRWGGGSISALPALTAELGCSQCFYFKPHNVFEEASGAHS